MLKMWTSRAVIAVLFAATLILCTGGPAHAQPRDPLTYQELMTALQTRVPNSAFQTKEALVAWVITQIRARKVEEPLTREREATLRRAGAPDAMIAAIRESSPKLPADLGPVDLGELAGRAIDLMKPEYTEEARRARTQGTVRLALELDEQGKVVSVSRIVVLENGLTEKAIEAARRSTFRPAMRNGKPVRGKGILSFNFKLESVDVSGILAAANAFRDRRECDRAIAEYGRVLSIEAKHPQALLGRGTCRLILGLYDAAEADMSVAAAADPSNPDALAFLAIAQDYLGEHLKAAGNYQKAIQIKPELDRQETLTCLYIDRSQLTPEQARAAAGRILSACDQMEKNAADLIKPLVSFKRGIAYRLRADHDKAIDEFERLKRSHPGFSAVNTQIQLVYNDRGLIAFNKKEYRKALEDVTRAINADPSSSTPYVNRCAIYAFGLKRYADAIHDCTYSIRLSAQSPSAFNYRAYAYEMTNERAAAIADYTKALELDPNNETARASLDRLRGGPPTMRDN